MCANPVRLGAGRCACPGFSLTKLKSEGCVIAFILGVGGLALCGVGIAGQLRVGALHHFSHISAIVMMATGGGVSVLALGVMGVVKKTLSIPPADMEKIQSLWKYLIEDEGGAYVLFGSKPMIYTSFSVAPRHAIARVSCDQYGVPMVQLDTSQPPVVDTQSQHQQEWIQAWCRHRDKFDLKDFMLLIGTENETYRLLFINKKSMLAILQQHETLFKEELGETFTPTSFLATLSTHTRICSKLFGIMLGYGESNATLFQQWEDLAAQMADARADEARDNQFKQQWEALNARRQPFTSSQERREPFSFPGFSADFSFPETQALKQRYTQERQRILELYQQPNFMQQVFQRLVTSDVN